MAEVKREILLAKTPELLAGLSDSECASVLSAASPREYMSHNVMCWAGDVTKEVLLLTDGRVKIAQFTESGLEVIMRLNVPGEIVGPRLEPGGRYSSTAQALQACSVLVWDAAVFAAVLEEFPAVRRNAEHIVARCLEELESRYCEVSTATVAPRLARAVVRLLDQLGQRVNGHLEINVSHEILAQMTAMNACTVSRLLGKWEEQGLVNVRRETLLVWNVLELQRICKAKGFAA